MSDVLPDSSCALISAPAAISILTRSTVAFSRRYISAVCSLRFLALTFAPAASSNCTISALLCSTAQANAFMPAD